MAGTKTQTGWGQLLSFEMLMIAAAIVASSSIGLYKVKALAESQTSISATHGDDVSKLWQQNSGVKATVIDMDKRLVEVTTNQKHFKEHIELVAGQLEENNKKQNQILILLQQIKTVGP